MTRIERRTRWLKCCVACWVIVLLVFGGACANEPAYFGSSEDNLSCSPWESKTLESSFEDAKTQEVIGCFALIRNGKSSESIRAKLTKDGNILVWSGSAFSGTSPLSFGSPAGDKSESVYALFYAANNPITTKSVSDSFCDSVASKASPLACVANGSCGFILALLPDKTPDGLTFALPDVPTGALKDDGKSCRLLTKGDSVVPTRPTMTSLTTLSAPPSFSPVTPEACNCSSVSYRTPKLFFDGITPHDIAMSADGLSMLLLVDATVGSNLRVYTRANKDAGFVLKEDFELADVFWRVHFAKDAEDAPFEFVLVGDRKIQVMNLKVLQDKGVSDAISWAKTLASSVAIYADVALYNSAVAFAAVHEGPTKGYIEFLHHKEEVELVAAYEMPGAQVLAWDRSKEYLLAGGREEKPDGPAPILRVFALDDDVTTGPFLKVTGQHSIEIKKRDTTLGVLAVSPDNRFILAGTVPDLKYLRGNRISDPVGKHGDIFAFSAAPLPRADVDKDTNLELADKKKPHDYVGAIAFHPAGKYAVSLGGSAENQVNKHLWELDAAAAPPFKLVSTVEIAGQNVAALTDCRTLISVSQKTPFTQSWQACPNP